MSDLTTVVMNDSVSDNMSHTNVSSSDVNMPEDLKREPGHHEDEKPSKKPRQLELTDMVRAMQGETSAPAGAWADSVSASSTGVPILPLSTSQTTHAQHQQIPSTQLQQQSQHTPASHQHQSPSPYEVMQGQQNEPPEDELHDDVSVASTLDYESQLLLLHPTGHDSLNMYTCTFASDLPATTNNKQAVIVHDMNVLSEKEIKAHWPLVESSLRKELGTFGELKTFRVIPRSTGKNVMTSKWIFKWKLIEGKKAVKGRLTVRGFQDKEQDMPTYASTATRWGQRIVCSVAAIRKWRLFTADVSSAFLQGFTFADLAKLTGEKCREACFTVPGWCAQYIRELPGFDMYDHEKHVLEMLKPVYGLKDAPRAWRLRLDVELRSLGGKPLLLDPSLYVWRTVDKKLRMIMSTHVDDLKGAGEEELAQHVCSKLSLVFGKLKIEQWHFEHCGITHTQDKETWAVTLCQAHYVEQLRVMKIPSLGSDSDALSVEDHHAFRSLLGAVSWLTQTRMDICVYVCALQRVAHCPLIAHAKQLNRLVKHIRRKVAPLVFQHMSGPMRVQVISDSAFRKEDSSGLAMRGAVIGLCMHHHESPGGVFHVLEFYSRKQKRVTRSTFAAELHALADAIEMGRLIRSAILEVTHGAENAFALSSLEGCSSSPWLEACVDAKSVYTALAAMDVSVPTEASLILVLLQLRELLMSGSLTALWWINTETMVADGMNKGTVKRDALLALGAGRWTAFGDMERYIHPKVARETRSK
eukprot:6492325-Amphidinium_carterae.1